MTRRPLVLLALAISSLCLPRAVYVHGPAS